ncbi:MAG: CDP-glucose 4,6-dehydratase [Myxococcales bacterium]|nr:CDP-glucose 4,6-dehydratase [Myxococcales bacterium]
MAAAFWHGKRVLVTGHTGFKGAWLSLWLARLGADVTGFALDPPTTPSLWQAADLGDLVRDLRGDVRDPAALDLAFRQARPEVVLHLAAQALVRASYSDPVGTFATNVMGTVHLLDAVRRSAAVRAVVVVTSDKCYENRETGQPYRESDSLGGRDPYSASKACAEIATAAWRRSFSAAGRSAIASVRAGNVIGGGDWATDRLVPDLLAGFAAGRPAQVRNPRSVRPWQHVLDPLAGYLTLAQRLGGARPQDDDPANWAQAWNFGPDPAACAPVGELARRLANLWGADAVLDVAAVPDGPPEAHRLHLDATLARERLGWRPRLALDAALSWTVDWHRSWTRAPAAARTACEDQIAAFEALADAVHA